MSTKNGKTSNDPHFKNLNKSMDREFKSEGRHGQSSKGVLRRRRYCKPYSPSCPDHTTVVKIKDNENFTTSIHEFYSATASLTAKSLWSIGASAVELEKRIRKQGDIKKDCFVDEKFNRVVEQVYASPVTGIVMAFDMSMDTYNKGLEQGDWKSKEDCIDSLKSLLSRINWKVILEDNKVDVYTFVFRLFELDKKKDISFQEKEVHSLGFCNFEEGDNIWDSYAEKTKKLADAVVISDLPSHPVFLNEEDKKNILMEQISQNNVIIGEMYKSLFGIETKERWKKDLLTSKQNVIFNKITSQFLVDNRQNMQDYMLNARAEMEVSFSMEEVIEEEEEE